VIRDFTPRLYQESILDSASRRNTLIVLPTGLGKTNIFLMLAAHRLTLYPDSKVLFLGPTRPLIEQYYEVFRKHLQIDQEKLAIFTGFVAPQKRAELWKSSQVVFSTPQGIENDIISGRIRLEEVCLLGFDEAHRAVGDYAYVFLARQFMKAARFPLITGLTASPGSDLEKINEVLVNLFIENIEVRTDEDADVRPYIQEIEIRWVKVELPKPFIEIQQHFKEFLKERAQKLKHWGILQREDTTNLSRKDLLMLQAQLRGRAASGEKDFLLWNAISVLAEIMKVSYALELLETQGIEALNKYISKVNSEASHTSVKAVKSVVQDINFKVAGLKVQQLAEQKVEHPKLIELQNIVSSEIKANPQAKIIVFNQYRDNAQNIASILSQNGMRAQLFVGQAKKGGTGISQKEQKALLERFGKGEFNVMCMTSVGEEGIDIPKVDLVIFFEPLPSVIRHIQRRGRTGRQEKGKVLVLMTKGTLDEGYRWAANRKEKRMVQILKQLQTRRLSAQPPLEKFIPEEDKVRILADSREKGNPVIKELVDNGARIHVQSLISADFITGRVGVEFKTRRDFVDSIIDGRLLSQLKELKRNFEAPLVVIEGEEDLFSIRNIHPNAVVGMLATIAVSYKVPLLFTKNYKETAKLIHIIAKREQEEDSSFSPHPEKKTSTLKEQQEYIVSSFPNIGLALARPLLRAFRSIKNLINASEEELKKVEKIGEKKARRIKEVVEAEYADDAPPKDLRSSGQAGNSDEKK